MLGSGSQGEMSTLVASTCCLGHNGHPLLKLVVFVAHNGLELLLEAGRLGMHQASPQDLPVGENLTAVQVAVIVIVVACHNAWKVCIV